MATWVKQQGEMSVRADPALGPIVGGLPAALWVPGPGSLLLGILSALLSLVTWLVLSEIYPVEVRGRAFAFCNSFNWA